MQKKEIEYNLDNQRFLGVMYCQDETTANQPAVLVAHAGEGR